MHKLKKSGVYRGGVSAEYVNRETNDVSFTCNFKEKFFDIRFSISSKGGGRTDILVRSDLYELAELLSLTLTEIGSQNSKQEKEEIEKIVDGREYWIDKAKYIERELNDVRASLKLALEELHKAAEMRTTPQAIKRLMYLFDQVYDSAQSNTESGEFSGSGNGGVVKK